MRRITRLTETDLRRIVKRVLKENQFLGNKDNFIDKIIKELTPPYIIDLKEMNIPIEYWEDIFSKIFNQKVYLKWDSGLNKLSVRNGTGDKIYYENSQGLSKKYESVDDNTVIEYVKGIINPLFHQMVQWKMPIDFRLTKDLNVYNFDPYNRLMNYYDYKNEHGTEFDMDEFDMDEDDIREGTLVIYEDFIKMVHNFNPNLSREKIVKIIKECFITEYDDASPKVMKIHRVRVNP